MVGAYLDDVTANSKLEGSILSQIINQLKKQTA